MCLTGIEVVTTALKNVERGAIQNEWLEVVPARWIYKRAHSLQCRVATDDTARSAVLVSRKNHASPVQRVVERTTPIAA
jgi:pyruvate carboxylase